MISRRIKVNVDDSNEKNIKFTLEQNVEEYKILSLKLTQKDIYQTFNADFGVLVGRVNANGRVGIPNAKISIFIPIDEVDINNPEIFSNYPYSKPTDINEYGKRYNLLPRVSRYDESVGENKPKQPFGSFPLKEEILVNETLLTIYKKYYKYSTVTNDSGDYMIFGVPIGTQTVHMSIDITDIGEFSMNPAAMVTNLGYSENLFTNNNTLIKPSADLDDLPHIETQEKSVDIIPFWGDKSVYEIGITRVDFRIRAKLNKTFVLFGSAFTDDENAMWGNTIDGNDELAQRLYYASDSAENTISINTKRVGNITEKIYYYPNTISDDDIISGKVDPRVDMQILNKTEYTIHKNNGDFVFIINCNRNKIIVDDYGNKVLVGEDNESGIYTEFRGFVIFEITDDEVSLNWKSSLDNNEDTKIKPFRFRLKIPQLAEYGNTFKLYEDDDYHFNITQNWRKQHFKFDGGKFYSVAKFNGLVWHGDDQNNNNFGSSDRLNNYGFFNRDYINTNRDFYNLPIESITNTGNELNKFRQVGIINTVVDNNLLPIEKFPANINNDYFGANWLNFSLYFPQFSYVYDGYSFVNDARVVSSATFDCRFGETTPNYITPNNQVIAANDFNTQFMARSDIHYSDFIEVPINDIRTMLNDYYVNDKGFKIDLNTISLTGTYKNSKDIIKNNTEGFIDGAGKINADPLAEYDNFYYFYLGHGKSNCIKYLNDLNLIT